MAPELQQDPEIEEIHDDLLRGAPTASDTICTQHWRERWASLWLWTEVKRKRRGKRIGRQIRTNYFLWFKLAFCWCNVRGANL